MAKIKFSYFYDKLRGFDGYPIKTATLLQVITVERKELSVSFIEYDTDNGRFKLPPNTYLLLILQKPSGDLMTTVRRFIPTKYTYYKSLEGQPFEIEIENVNTF
jgi:hypothetical protein